MATRTKTRGPVSPPYRGPYGTPLAHVHYREGRHMEPDRIPFHRHEVPVSLRLMDVSKESMENVRKVAASIKRLLAPSLKLQAIPDCLLVYLAHLERLDLGNNRLTDASFPDSMKSLELLIELRLNDNQLTRVPSSLKRMRSLCRLDLSNNQLDTAAGLERLKKLQFLVLDNNNLNAVFKDISSLKKLEMLRCSSNNLRDVPRDIRNLRHLRDLDLSNNRIVLLPTDVFQLPRLECFNASQNQVGKVPSFNVKVQNRRWISSVDLSDNNLVKFPGHLMQLAQKLDLSCNKIRTLSWATLKKMDMDKDQELKLDSNPLVYPPPDVCESGLKTIVQFFQESQADVKTYQGVKILVIGSHRSGKSSLIHSLVDQQARMYDDSTGETAAGIDAYETSFDYDVEDGKPGKSLNLCLWDLCGDPFYLYPHYIFHEQPSITVLTFSLADYSAEEFGQQIGAWFDWMIAKTNKLVVILVATKSDLVKPKRAGEITREVREKLAKHLQKRQTMIEARIKEIEKRPVISPTLSEQLKTYMRLLQAKFTVQTEVITTSCKTFDGFDKLREAIETLANERKLFPNVMRVIPTFWVEVENWVEERGNALVVPVMPWDEFSEEVTTRFGMKHLLVSITQYLHESGKVLWFSTSPSLKEIVFLRPSWLFDVLKQVFRHDLEVAAFTPDDTLKVIAFTPTKFERLKQDLLNDGVVDRELLKALLVSLMPADISKPSLEVLQILTERLEMGYPVAKKSRDLTYNLSGAEKDAEGKTKINKLLIPWFRRSAEPDSFREKWTGLRDRRRLSVVFKFPCYMPPGLFELMTVRAHNNKHKLAFLAHWGGGVHARHTEEKVQLLITYFRDGAEDVEVASSTSSSSSASPNNLLGDEVDNDDVGGGSDGGGDDMDDGFVEGGGSAEERTGERPGAEKQEDEKDDDDDEESGMVKTGAAPTSTAKNRTSTKTVKEQHHHRNDDEDDNINNNNNNSADRERRNKGVDNAGSSRGLPSDGSSSAAPRRQPVSSTSTSRTGGPSSSTVSRNRKGNKNNSNNNNNNNNKQNTSSNKNVSSGSSSSGKKKSISQGQELDLPETIEEVEEEEEEEVTDEEQEEEEDEDVLASSGRSIGAVNNNRPASGSSSKGQGQRSSGAHRDGEAGGGVQDGLRAPTVARVRNPSECIGNDESAVVLKMEIRDDSEDKQDQTPASSMWNILLPLLMDFEDLLTAYSGVLVERRTLCPMCKEASFLGEWLTPKETQGMNTRTCDACKHHVDTAFLVQPREKKRDDVMRALIRRTVRRRGAAVTSDIDDIQKVAPPNPRRAALVPIDIADDSLRRLLGHRDSVASDD